MYGKTNAKCKVINLQLNKFFSKKIIHYDKARFIPGIKGFYNIHKSIDVKHYINRLKYKTI